MTDSIVPAEFADRITRSQGAEGETWLASLPALDGEPRYGRAGLVVPAIRDDGPPTALKLGRRNDETRDEPLALSTWDGQGAVLLLENAPEDSVLLLERLDADRARAWTLLRAVQNWFWSLEEPDSDDPAFAAVPQISQWAAR